MARRCAVLAFFASLAAVGMVYGQSPGACNLRAGYTPYGVYTFTEQDGTASGADIDLIRALAAELGCTASFHELPWARVLLDRVDGFLVDDVGVMERIDAALVRIKADGRLQRIMDSYLE